MTRLKGLPTWEAAFKSKLLEPEQVAQTVNRLRQEGRTIATLNGSFDLLHAGHLHILYSAAQAADILIVALNTDRSIKEYKSPKRPIIPLEYRMQMIAALGWVDYVTYFDETDPIAFLTKVKPDVHVNGSEYGENCIEAETVKRYGGRIEIVQLVPGLSTSAVLAKCMEAGSTT